MSAPGGFPSPALTPTRVKTRVGAFLAIVPLTVLVVVAATSSSGAAESPAASPAAAEVVRRATCTTGGRELQEAFQALAARKAEALPLVKARLRDGEAAEQFTLTKFLRCCPWPETRDELVALACDGRRHWLPRQGALHALGALGDRAAGPAVTAVLAGDDCPVGMRLAAIAALARMHYGEAAGTIRAFTRSEDIHVRLFAARALAEFGEAVDREFLLAALADGDYVVRQEACGALGAAGVGGPLQELAGRDPHQAVRAAAAQAVLECRMRGRPAAGKLAVLRDALPGADHLTATWILRAMLEQGGDEGRALVQSLAAGGGRLGERSRAYLNMEARE